VVQKAPGRGKHRKRRTRAAWLSMMLHQDASTHDWVPGVKWDWVVTIGRPRKRDLRELLNAIFYLNKTGCPWRYLPKDFPPYKLVNYYYTKWTDNRWPEKVTTVLRQRLRQKKTESQIQREQLLIVKVSREPRNPMWNRDVTGANSLRAENVLSLSIQSVACLSSGYTPPICLTVKPLVKSLRTCFRASIPSKKSGAIVPIPVRTYCTQVVGRGATDGTYPRMPPGRAVTPDRHGARRRISSSGTTLQVLIESFDSTRAADLSASNAPGGNPLVDELHGYFIPSNRMTVPLARRMFMALECHAVTDTIIRRSGHVTPFE